MKKVHIIKRAIVLFIFCRVPRIVYVLNRGVGNLFPVNTKIFLNCNEYIYNYVGET